MLNCTNRKFGSQANVTSPNAPYQRCIHMKIRFFSASIGRLRKDWVCSIQGTDNGNHDILEHIGSCIWKSKRVCLLYSMSCTLTM